MIQSEILRKPRYRARQNQCNPTKHESDHCTGIHFSSWDLIATLEAGRREDADLQDADLSGSHFLGLQITWTRRLQALHY